MTPVEAARRYIGVPFLHQGRDPATGIDCIGLLVLAFRDAGTALADATPAEYARDPHAGALEDGLHDAFGEPVARSRPSQPIDLALLQVGDVVALHYTGPVRHVGLVADHPHGLALVHTDSRVGRVTEHRIDDHWRRKIRLAFRPEIAA